MSGARKSESRKPVRGTKSRPTIGLLIGRLGDIGYAARVWPGVAAVAEEQDVNLICFVGGALNALHEFDAQRNVIYDLVSPESVDGLVAMSGSIGQFIGPDRLQRFYERFRPLPMVGIAMELEGIPNVLVDNSAGMRDAVTHLIQIHGLRRIAFIRGPATNPEAEQRYQTYVDVLLRHGLAYDPDLVASGNFLSPAGAEAIRLFLDKRKVGFEAVVSANDEMALGALAALRERGLRVPENVRVVGFDDLEEGRFAAPPLTTIRQPLDEQGRKAAEMLLALMAGKKVPPRVTLATELVVRQSCGCFPPMVFPAAAGRGKAKVSALAQRKQILLEMAEAAGASAAGLDPGWAERLLGAFSNIKKGGKSMAVFLGTWDELLRRVGAGGGDVMQWHGVLSALGRRAQPPLAGGEAPPTWAQQARSLMGEVAQWAQAHRRIQSERRAFEFTTRISEPLMTAFDVASLTDVVAEQLPKLGIRSCYLSLYERPADGGTATPTEWSNLILAYNEKGRVKLEPGGSRFPSRQLVPQDILPSEKRYAVMLEPLHFRDETQLGFILFEPLHTEAGALREALSRQISTALKGAVLLQESRRAEETLRASEWEERDFQGRLRTLLEISNELSRAESVEALCRQAVELGRARLGFDRLGIWFRSPDPGIVIGSYGTNYDGRLSDERGIRLATKGRQMEILGQTRPIAMVWNDTEERDGLGNYVGRRALAQAAMWDGEKVIGFVSMDNLLHHRPITDTDGELLNLYASSLGYLCSRKRAEEELKEYSGRLEEMVEERTRELREAQENLVRREKLAVLGQLAATVSHELRNPLATIRVSASTLDLKVRDRGLGVERSLDRIQRNITRCDNIISELLDYARMPELKVQTVDFDDWINRLLDEQVLPEGIVLRRDTASGTQVSMDPERFRRVIINLMDNACQSMQATPPAERGVKVLGVQTRMGGDRLQLVISDNGTGIPPEVMPRIYEPLYSTKGFGAGLGLSVVKGIIEQHGGEIAVTSEAGKGARVIVRLPLIRPGG